MPKSHPWRNAAKGMKPLFTHSSAGFYEAFLTPARRVAGKLTRERNPVIRAFSNREWRCY
jgi:hypothetical protein